MGFHDRRHQPIEPFTGARRQCNDRHALDLRQHAIGFLAQSRANTRLPLDQVHFVEADDDGAPFPLDEVGNPDVLLFERGLAHRRARSPLRRSGWRSAYRQPKAFRASPRRASGAVVRPCRRCAGDVRAKSRSTAIASRVIPASGPVTSRSSPSSRLISVDLPVFGRPTTAMRIGFSSVSAVGTSSRSTSSVLPRAAPRAAPRRGRPAPHRVRR